MNQEQQEEPDKELAFLDLNQRITGFSWLVSEMRNGFTNLEIIEFRDKILKAQKELAKIQKGVRR